MCSSLTFSSLTDSCPLEFPHVARILVSTDLHCLKQVLSWFDQCRQPSSPHFVWLQCQLALAEAFTNAVRHAHRDKPQETPIEIEVSASDRAIELRIWDMGAGFNLEHCLQRGQRRVDTSAEGGRGLSIIQQMADGLSYSRMPDQRNCLVIIKQFSVVESMMESSSQPTSCCIQSSSL